MHGGARAGGAVVDEQDILLSDEDEAPRAKVSILYEMCFNLKLSGNEVYYTACPLRVILKNRVVNLIARKF